MTYIPTAHVSLIRSIRCFVGDLPCHGQRPVKIVPIFGGLNENDPHRVVCLNAWSQMVGLFGDHGLVGGDVLRGWGVALEDFRSLCHPSSSSPSASRLCLIIAALSSHSSTVTACCRAPHHDVHGL